MRLALAANEPLAELFTEDASYRLSPHDDPALGLEAIGALWERERKGADEVFTLTSEVFAVSGDRAVVTLEVRYGDPVEREFRDVWLLQFEMIERNVRAAIRPWPSVSRGPRRRRGHRA